MVTVMVQVCLRCYEKTEERYTGACVLYIYTYVYMWGEGGSVERGQYKEVFQTWQFFSCMEQNE